MDLLLHPEFNNSKNIRPLAEFMQTQSPPHCLSGMTAVPMWNLKHQQVFPSTANSALGEVFELLFVNALLHLGVAATDISPKHNNDLCAELDVVVRRGSRLIGVFLKTSSRERWKQVRGDSICYHFDVGKVKSDLQDKYNGQSLELWSITFMEHFEKQRRINKIKRSELANPIEDLELARKHAPSYFGVEANRVCGIFDAVRVADLERSLMQTTPSWANDPYFVFEEVLKEVSVSSRQIQALKQIA